MSKSKRSKSNLDFYGIIQRFIKDTEKSPYQLCKTLKVSKSRLSFYIGVLKRNGAIKKVGYGVWKVCNSIQVKKRKGPSFSLGTTNGDINLHALNINVPMTSGVLDLKKHGGYAQKRFNNWIPQYKRVITPIGVTLKNNNNKSIDLQIWSRSIINLDEVQTLILRSLYFAQNLLLEMGVKIDVLAAKVKTLHLAVKDKDIDKVLNKGTTIEVMLNRKANKLLSGDDDRDAIAWTDSSPFRGIESNDIQYIKNYVIMPERVEHLYKILLPLAEGITDYTEAILNHNKAILDISAGIQNFNKSVSRLNTTLSYFKFIVKPKSKGKNANLKSYF